MKFKLNRGKSITLGDKEIPISTSDGWTEIPDDDIINVLINAGKKHTSCDGWAVVGDVVVESEDVIYYTFDLTGKTEVICLVVLKPLADSTSHINGTIGLNAPSTPWSTGVRVADNIGSVASSEKANCTLLRGEVINGKWIPAITIASGNYVGNAYVMSRLYGVLVNDNDNANNFQEVGELRNIAVGSYTKFFGVGSHIYVIAR